jgi:hypothetical protein
MKTINHILETLKVKHPSTIEDLSNHFKCYKHDILNSLFENGFILLSENGFVESDYGENYIISGNNIKTFKWDTKLCNFLLYDILFNGRKRYKTLNPYFERIYNGENIIEKFEVGYEINISLTADANMKLLLNDPQNHKLMPKFPEYAPSFMRDIQNNRENYNKFWEYAYNGQVIKTINYRPSITVNAYPDGSIICIDTVMERVNFYMVVNDGYNESLGNYKEIEELRWNETIEYTKNLPEIICLDYLINNYQTIVTKLIETSDGIDFWKRMIENALSQQLKVYSGNHQKIESLQDFDEYSNDTLIISSKDFYGC